MRMTFQKYIEIYRNRIILAGAVAFKYKFFNKCITSWIQNMRVFHVLFDIYEPPTKTTGKR